MKNNDIHSEEWFTDAREYWWDEDYLELLINRLGLKNISTIADIGCGNGFMTRKMLPHLPNVKNCLGIDMEKEHISAAKKHLNSLNLDLNVDFKVGDAENIECEDNSSDLTVCQTLLIHLNNPLKAVKEMKRITKEGGTVIAIETNNSINSLIRNSYLNDDMTLDNIQNIPDTLKLLEYDLTIQKGIHNLKEGYLSLGDYVPRLFLEAGLKDISVSILDKACSLIPPYDTPEKKAIAKELLDWIDSSSAEFDYSQMKKYYLAGGGTEENFEASWKLSNKESQKIKTALLNETYIMPGGALMYIVSGKK